MKDFDFDELDRAVSSVLTKKQDNTDKPAEAAGNGQPTDVAPTTGTIPVSDAQGGDDHNVQVNSVDDKATSQAPPQAATEPAAAQNDTEPEAEDTQSPVVEESVSTGEVKADDKVAEDALASITADIKELSSDTDGAKDAAVSDITADSSSAPEVSGESVEISTTNESEAAAADNPTSEQPAPAENTTTDESAQKTDDTPVDPAASSRGRFMDMIKPQAEAAHKPLGSHGSITISAPGSEQSGGQPASGDTAVNAPDPLAEVPKPEAEQPAPHDEQTTTDTEGGEQTATPFIPDVAVEKRPLNPISSDVKPDPVAPQPATEAAPADEGPIVEPVSNPTAIVNGNQALP